MLLQSLSPQVFFVFIKENKIHTLLSLWKVLYEGHMSTIKYVTDINHSYAYWCFILILVDSRLKF